MATPLQEFRNKYPQYNDLDDETVAENLHTQYYSHIDPADFRRRLGIAPPPFPPAELTPDQKFDERINIETQKDPFDDTGLQSMTLHKNISSLNKNKEVDGVAIRKGFDAADWKPENDTGFFTNASTLATERAVNLSGHLVRGLIGRPGDWLESKLLGGSVVFGTDWGADDPADGKFRVRYMTESELEKHDVKNTLTDTLPDYLIDADFDVEERTSTTNIKDAFRSGDVSDTTWEIIKFGTEQGIKSTPDMLAALSGVGGVAAYTVARSDEMADDRAANKGLEESTIKEQVEALPFALGSALFERFGAGKIIESFGKDAKKEIGKELIEAGLAYAAKRMAEKTGKAIAAEGITEFVQEGIIEYLGEKLGTEAKMSLLESGERGLFGLLAGGTFAGSIALPGAAMSESALVSERKKIPTLTESADSIESDIDSRETLDDPRLKRQGHRIELVKQIKQLLGTDPETGNLSSSFSPKSLPTWYQAIPEDIRITAESSVKALKKALAGKPLGVGESRIIESALDYITDERVSDENITRAKQQLDAARKTRRKAQRDAAIETGKAIPESHDDIEAGEIFDESEYLPEMDGEARIVHELAAKLDDIGFTDQANKIIEESVNTADAIKELEKLTQVSSEIVSLENDLLTRGYDKFDMSNWRLDNPDPAEYAKYLAEKRARPDALTAEELSRVTDFAQMTNDMIEQNKSMSIDVVRKELGDDMANEYIKNRPGSDRGQRWLEENLDKEIFDKIDNQWLDVDRIRLFSDYVNQVDERSPELLGASIGTLFLDIDKPGFEQSPEYAGILSAIDVAQRKGWDMEEVFKGMRERAIQYAGNDALELFPRFFEKAKAKGIDSNVEKAAEVRNSRTPDTKNAEQKAKPESQTTSTTTQEGITDRRQAPREQQVERRQNTVRRDRVASMSIEQVVNELYTDPLTGLLNERAFNEDIETAKAVGSLDVDGLGGVNDHLGHESGDRMLQAVGIALERLGVDAYHKSGDEFYVLGDTVEQVRDALAQVQQDLAQQKLETDRGALNGIHITTGTGTSRIDADTAMEKNKKTREAAGKRNRKGELPPGGVLYSSNVQYAPGSNYVGLAGQHGDMPINADHEYVKGDGTPVNIPVTPVRRRHIMRLVQRLFGFKIYEGKIKAKGVGGYYRPGHGEIRNKKANDIEVAAHEMSHWLDEHYPWIKELYKQYPTEMAGISYDENLDYEGYAEFMRHWFTQDYIAMKTCPGFYDAWMKALIDRPELDKKVKMVQELMHGWYLQGARARLKDKIGKTNISLIDRAREALTQMPRKFLQGMFDELRTFKEAERAVWGEVKNAAKSGYSALRLARGAHGVMQAIFYRGTVNWNEEGDIEFNGDGIKKIFEPVSDKMEDMQAYMVARRGVELMDQGRENLLRPDEIMAGLRLGEENPEFAKVFDEFQKFNSRMMDFYQESGLLSEQSRLAIEEMNKNYVPFNRIMETAAGEKVKGGGSPFMRLKGGTHNINDVFDNIVANTSRLVHLALVNRGKSNFYKMIMSSKNQQGGLYASPLKTEVKPTQVDRDQVIKNVVDAMGWSMKEYRAAKDSGMATDEEITMIDMIDNMAEGLEPYVTFFQFGQDPTGPNIDYYLEEGKKVFYEIGDPLLWESIQSVGPKAGNLALSILGGFANILRTGVTLTPTFQAKNFIRDTFNAYTLSKGKRIPAVDAIKALTERLYNDEHYWEYMANGGGFASMADAEGINRDRILDNPKAIMRHLQQGLSAFEYANRIAEFKSLRKKGWSKRDAALAGREISTDFAMRGGAEFLRWFTVSVPFLNARLQGLYRNARELARLEKGRAKFVGATASSYALRSLLAITIPSLMLYMWNREDDRYKAIPDWIKDLNWIMFTGEGEDDYVMIPKPFETGMLWGTVPERAMEYYYERDQKELGDAMLWMIMQTFDMNAVPQAYKVWDDLEKNKNFTGAPIIPEYLEDVEPMEQYRAYTSDAMIALGRKLNISPIKAEYIVRGHLGTLGTYALQMADYAVGDITNSGTEPTKTWRDNLLLNPFVNDGPLRRTDQEDDMYEMLKMSRQMAATARLIERRSPERLEQYIDNPDDPETQLFFGLNKALNDAAAAVREINHGIDQVRANPEMSGDDKREQIFELMRAKNEITAGIRSAISPDMIDNEIKKIREMGKTRSGEPR